MALTLVIAPAEDPITTAEAKAFMRVDVSEDDALIGALIDAAVAHIDGKDGWLNRALVTQTWELRLDAFPCWEIRVPLAPLQSVTSITYVDTAGVSQTLDASKYTVDAKSEPGRITPAYGETWPSTRGQVNAITVRFVAGYGAAAAVPETLKLGLKCLVAHFYEHREPVVTGTIAAKLPMHVENLLLPYKVWTA